MDLDDKIKETFEFCCEQFRRYKLPVLYCSFGKDSTVLLHLLLSRKIQIPIIFHADPWFPRKTDFARGLISKWNLEVHDYPPHKTSLMHGKEIVALVSQYQTGPHSDLAVLKNALEFKDGDDPDKFLCGLNFLMRPCAILVYPWDVGLVAHKDVDEDQIFGLVPLHSRVVYRDEGPDFIFPLKEWTHDDIWDYTERFNVPYQTDRYDLATRRELPDKTPNSDWYETCLRCVDKRLRGQKVFCPKMKVELENVSGAAPEYGLVPDYFGTVKKG
jgi:hypothetical protein